MLDEVYYHKLLEKKDKLLNDIKVHKDRLNFESEIKDYKAYIYINENELNIGIIKKDKTIFSKLGYFNNREIANIIIKKYGDEILLLNKFSMWN